MISERIKALAALTVERGQNAPASAFFQNLHSAALGLYAECPQWEKIARSMAYAIANMPVHIYPEDTIGGRTYQNKPLPPETVAADLDCDTPARAEFLAQYPEAELLFRDYLITGTAKGHIIWDFSRVLTLGITGLRTRFEEALAAARDEDAEQFYRGVLILLDAVLAFNDKHIAAYRAAGMHELADRMAKVPRQPAETFREAVQAFHMQHLCVMAENPYGGNGPGRLDYYLWPYLERDLAAGRCTLEEAKEIIDELFLRFDERLYGMDGWVEAVVIGGSHANGGSAVNPLSYIMLDSIMDLDILHPSVYVRLPKNPPAELVSACARYILSGNNRAQILSDEAIMGALIRRGISTRDAADYVCGGCMEVGLQGMSSDYLYIGWHNPPKMLELMLTGGECLLTGKKNPAFHANKSLAGYTDFESFYADFIAEATRITRIYLAEQDIGSKWAQRARPSYLISSMIDDCLERGRNMHGGGARYHDYGGTPLGLPNVADGLYAVKRAVFEDKLCTAEELLAALKADFKGYERLQAQLKRLPKYGVNDPAADAMARRVASDFADIYEGYTTRWGGKGKLVILTFTFAPPAAAVLGATADGGNANRLVAHGVTPHSSAMTEGITSAILSAGCMPFEKFAGGASTMWDFDPAWATEPIVEAVLRTFIENGGQIFQGDVTPLEELLAAQKNPAEHANLVVRVGGYSARFVNLSPELQENVICRIRHNH